MPETPPREGLRETKKRETRRAIARAAIALFLERGFEEVTVAEVAQRAGVSKMTVFNYFDTKADMMFELGEAALPDLAGAVRRRATGTSVLEAALAYYLSELDRFAEWTGLHDGIEPFARMAQASPTLTAAFGQRWEQLHEELSAEIAAATGERPSSPGAPAGSGDITHRVVAAQISAALRELTAANIAQIFAGRSAADSLADARAQGELAFALLAAGAGDYGRRASGSA